MADNGLNNMGDVSQQASDQVTGKIKEKAEKGAKEVANKVGKKVGKAVKKGAKKVAKATAKVVKAAVKAAVKTAVTVIKTLISLIVKLLVVAWPFVLILLVIVIVLVVIADVIYGERGSGQVNDFNPAVMNPTLIDENTKAVTALAQTEPQAVVDAYYKYLSTQSFTKEYNDKLYEFADEDETADFSALRDYYDGENYFYLSDDFIRMVDETLHGNVLYYPEQVIKPVFGKNLTVENKEGNEMIAYTLSLIHI